MRAVQLHFIRLVDPLVADLKNHLGNLATLRKAPERLDQKQRSRLNNLFVAHSILKTVHEGIHQLRELMDPELQSSK